jgi:hypothetical protein
METIFPHAIDCQGGVFPAIQLILKLPHAIPIQCGKYTEKAISAPAIRIVFHASPPALLLQKNSA